MTTTTNTISLPTILNIDYGNRQTTQKTAKSKSAAHSPMVIKSITTHPIPQSPLTPSLQAWYRQIAINRWNAANGQAFEDLIGELWQHRFLDAINVQPYGGQGDCKTDLYIMSTQQAAQCYAPDVLTPKSIEEKITKTLSATFSIKNKVRLPGLPEYWGDNVKEIIFAFKGKELTAPTIMFVKEQEKKFKKKITIYLLNNYLDDIDMLAYQKKVYMFGPAPRF